MTHRLLNSRGPSTTPGRPERPNAQLGQELGRGRSGSVFLQREADGRPVATKVFESRSVTKLVQLVLLGAPNPYLWSRAAIRCAYLRRRILAGLVRYWFDSRLSVADATGLGWNPEARAFELRTEFCAGRAPRLDNPVRAEADDEVAELRSDVMRPLQERLIEAGFDGLAWQAGKGNPVALNNFLLVAKNGGRRWTWIDLESRIPAVAPLSPWALVRFYIPRSIAIRRPLFDDVNIPRLRAYLATERAGLTEELGGERYRTLVQWTDRLAHEQKDWKSQPRHRRSIGYRHARGSITADQAVYFSTRPVRWYLRELAGMAVGVLSKVHGLPAAAWAKLDVRGLVARSLRFLVSERYRSRLARLYLLRRLAHWRRREQLDRTDANLLRRQLDELETGSYLTDFGVHLAIKPITKIIAWALLPALYGAGLISTTVLLIALAGSGSIARTTYSGWRTIQATIRRQRKPWVALSTGVLPVLGTFAYPLQILYASTRAHDTLARFILADANRAVHPRRRVRKHRPQASDLGRAGHAHRALVQPHPAPTPRPPARRATRRFAEQSNGQRAVRPDRDLVEQGHGKPARSVKFGRIRSGTWRASRRRYWGPMGHDQGGVL